MYNRIKKWYENGLWSKENVANAVKKGLLTPTEYEEITGEEYE